jgi:oligopeptide/dipeptide ABC transporter ATP-binding protein
MDEDIARLYSIEGQPPALWDLPPGCRFAPRCPYVEDRCRESYPPAFALNDDHTAHCWKLSPEWQTTSRSFAFKA